MGHCRRSTPPSPPLATSSSSIGLRLRLLLWMSLISPHWTFPPRDRRRRPLLFSVRDRMAAGAVVKMAAASTQEQTQTKRIKRQREETQTQSSPETRRPANTTQRRCSLSPTPQTTTTIEVDEISPYYHRDRRDVDSRQPLPSNVTGLASLLARRYRAQHDHNYEKVLELDQAMLFHHNVTVYEHPFVWTTRRQDPPVAILRQQAQRRIQDLQAQYGVVGHPYSRAATADDCAACRRFLPEIHVLLLQRWQCRLRNATTTMTLLDGKLHTLGVHVHDDDLTWSTVDTDDDGHQSAAAVSNERAIRMTSPTPPSSSSSSTTWSYDDDGSFVPDGRIVQRVEQLLLSHTLASHSGNAYTCQCIACELYCTYHVAVNLHNCTWTWAWKQPRQWTPPQLNDEATKPPAWCTWSASPLFYGFDTLLLRTSFIEEQRMPMDDAALLSLHDLSGYRRSAQSKPLSTTLQPRVEQLLLARLHKRDEAKYAEADALRKELWVTYRVGVNDRLKQYSVGGIFDDE